jgi:hypothetical protein
MRITKLIMMVIVAVVIAIPCSILTAQEDTQSQNYGNNISTPGHDQDYGNKDLTPGIDAGRGPSFSDPQVEPSPWGGRESQYPPYHQDTH